MAKENSLFKLLPTPRSKFVSLKCLKCDNRQIAFSHASTRVCCNVCGEVLLEPTGGKAKIRGEVVSVLE